MNYQDNFSAQFCSEHNFLTFLDEVELRADWIVYPTNLLQVYVAEEIPDVCEKIEADTRETAVNVLKDTWWNTKLLLQAGDQLFAVGSTAIKTLENRARISGYALADLEKEKLARILNDCLQVTKGKAMLRFHEGKVRAVHGGDEGEYVRLPMPQIFEVASVYMRENYENAKFTEGFFDHTMTMATWSVEDDRLLDTYRELLLQYGQLADNHLSASIQVTSSDVGVSGANIFCRLLIGKEQTPLVLGGPRKLPHKSGASIDAFSANVAQTFARYQEEVEGLSGLFQVYVNYPENVMASVMKKAEIGVALRAQTVERFRVSHGTGRCNAYEIYCGICESIFLAQSSGMTARGLVDLEEKVSKCLKFKFQEYDFPGSIRY